MIITGVQKKRAGRFLLKVICNGIGIINDVDPGQTLIRLADPVSFKKILSFLATLKDRGPLTGPGQYRTHGGDAVVQKTMFQKHRDFC